VPSVTDTIIALGAAECLVGISADCEQPRPGAPVPVVTRPVISPEQAAADPAGVDESVRSLLACGALLYGLEADLLAALEPDVVFGQDSCGVCAIPLSEVADRLRANGRGVEVVSIDPRDLDEVLGSFALVGGALGGEFAEAGEALERQSRQRLVSLSSQLSSGAVRPRVLALDWLDPPFLAGNWVPELIYAAGGRDPAGGTAAGGTAAGGTAAGGTAAGATAAGATAAGATAGSGRTELRDGSSSETAAPSRESSLEAIAGLQPDWLVVALCGVGLADAVSSAGACSWIKSLVRQGTRVLAADGRIWFSRPGPRLVDGAEALAAWLSGQGVAPSSSDGILLEITERLA
jgi:iron complex transport system substrate-binding protein